MKIFVLILLSLSLKSFASFPELFGTSAGSMAIGSQPEKSSAANNALASALLGFSKNTQFSFNTSYVMTDFHDINNVITKNQTNTVNSYSRDNVQVNSTPTIVFSGHFSTPLFKPEGPKLNLSVFAPTDRMLEADSGDPYAPRYAMYENRFIRPNFIATLAQSFHSWSFSLGAQTGMQANGETYLVTRTTSGNPSLSKISFNAKPSLSIVASIAKKFEKGMSFLSFQEEMKSKFKTRATGETEIGGGTSFPFDFKISSLLYYDPMIIRAGHQLFFDKTNLFISLEYQQWTTYQSSTVKLQKNGGSINGSNDLETIQLKNIFIPRVGFEHKWSDRFATKLGYFYRPSPIKTSGLKYAGNTIDTDKHVGSVGGAYFLPFMDKILTVDLSYQGHFLQTHHITKTPNREDGDPSQLKIGSPGYTIGGMIHVLSLGLSWMI